MYLSDGATILLEGMTAIACLCWLWVISSCAAQIYITRRVKYLEGLNTGEAQNEIQKLRSFYNSCRCVNSPGIVFIGTELLTAINERLTRVVGMAAIIICSSTTIFWAWVTGLRRRSEKPKIVDVELGTHLAEDFGGGMPPDRRIHALGAANPPGE